MYLNLCELFRRALWNMKMDKTLFHFITRQFCIIQRRNEPRVQCS